MLLAVLCCCHDCLDASKLTCIVDAPVTAGAVGAASVGVLYDVKVEEEGEEEEAPEAESSFARRFAARARSSRVGEEEEENKEEVERAASFDDMG